MSFLKEHILCHTNIDGFVASRFTCLHFVAFISICDWNLTVKFEEYLSLPANCEHEEVITHNFVLYHGELVPTAQRLVTISQAYVEWAGVCTHELLPPLLTFSTISNIGTSD